MKARKYGFSTVESDSPLDVIASKAILSNVSGECSGTGSSADSSL